MKRLAIPALLFAVLGAAAIVTMALRARWRRSVEEEEPRAAMRRRETASVSDLAAAADRLDEQALIAALATHVAELERRLEALEASRQAAAAVPEDGRTGSPAGDADAAATAELEAAAAWLARAFPGRFGEITAAEASHLRELDLREVELAETDLEHLAALSSLRSLSLRGTAATDEDLASLHGLARLRSLELRGTEVTGEGLTHLPPGLRELDLTDSKVTGPKLQRLPALRELESIDLNRLPLDDGVVEVLGRYPSLRRIELDGTGVTDEGLRRLLELNPALERLELRGAKTTPAGIREAMESHPGLAIVLGTQGIDGTP